MSAGSITTTTSARLGMMLTDLRLPTIKRLAGDLCAQSDLEGWPAHRLLEALLEHEINEREARRIDRHRNESSLSPDKRLSSFDFSAVLSVSKAQVMALSGATEWLDRGANVLLFGPPGVGKSHLVCALGHALIHAGRRVLFTRCSDLVQRLPQELAKLDRFDLLILDDLSYVRRDQAETSVLFELICERYERKSLVITANAPFSQWGEVFVEPAMTLAAGDRLVHHATILKLTSTRPGWSRLSRRITPKVVLADRPLHWRQCCLMRQNQFIDLVTIADWATHKVLAHWVPISMTTSFA